MSIRTQIKKGIFLSYLSTGFNIIAGLIYTPWMVHQIGQSNYGLYTLASSFISLFMLDFGISGALGKFLSKYRAEDKVDECRKILGATYILYFIIDLIALIVLSGIYFNLSGIYQELTHSELTIFKILFLIVAFFNIISFPATTLNGILVSYERFIALKSCDLINKVLSILFVILALYCGYGVVAIVLANVISNLIIILIKLVIILKRIKIKPQFRNLDKTVYKDIFSISIWTTLMSLAQRFIYNISPTILTIVSGAIAVSIYAPASTIGGYFYVIAASVNGMFLPYISRKIHENKNDDINRLMYTMGKFQMIILGWIVVVFITLGNHFMILWMGEEYSMSYICGILILLPALFEYSQQIGTTVILAQNYIKYQSIGFCIISVISLVLSYYFGLKWSVIGVCIAISLGGFCNVFLQLILFAKLKINIKAFLQKSIVPLIIPYSITITIGMIISMHISTSWAHFMVSLIIVSVIYCGTCAITAVGKKDLNYIKN